MASSSSSSSTSKHLLLLFLVCGLLCSACWPTAARILDDDRDDVMRKFTEWTEKYGREYKNEAEKLRRLRIFADNLKYVSEFPKAAGDGRRYSVGLNQFADLTNEEFLASRTGFKLPPTATSEPTTAGPTAAPLSSHHNATTEGGVPSSIDWRTRGAVTAVKNQGSCGSCWAFSAVAAIESAILIEGQRSTDLSEQELIDCVSSNFGCQGGWMDNAFDFVARNGGITTEARYPYVGSQGHCQVTMLQDHVASISGFRDVPANDEGALMEAVAQQPVSVAIAIDASFQLYSGGVYDGPCGTTLNHAVTLVGYGEDEQGNEYWIAKNSWGTSWGDEGYVLMKKDVPQKEGLCGIAKVASYPTA